MAGIQDAKYMIMYMTVILIISHLFAGYLNLPGLADASSPITKKFIYNSNSSEFGINQVTDEGRNFIDWSGSFNQSVESENQYDFNFFSWGIIKTPFLVAFDFMFAPATLTYKLLEMDDFNLTFLNYIPYLVGVVWLLAYVFTFIQIFTGRN